MVNPLSLRALLTSAVALTLGRAAVVDKRECTEVHNGYLQIGTTTGFLVRVTGYVKTAAAEDAFGQVPLMGGSGERATFNFKGCQGGDPFYLYCTNCDPSKNSAVKSRNSTTSGVEPDIWQFYNDGPSTAQDRREEHVTRRSLLTSIYPGFQWGSDGYIHPVIASDTLALASTNAWYTASTDEITFIVDLGSPDTYNVLIWDEIPS